MKRIDLIHKEKNEECFEILQSTIIEDKELKKFRIDKDTLFHELPEPIVNEFLDFLGRQGEFRELTLHMIKSGTLVINCWEEDEVNKERPRLVPKKSIRNSRSNTTQKPFDPLEGPLDDRLPF